MITSALLTVPASGVAWATPARPVDGGRYRKDIVDIRTGDTVQIRPGGDPGVRFALELIIRPATDLP